MAVPSLSLREKRLIQAAVVLAIIVLISLLLRGGGGAEAPQAPIGPVASVAPPSPPTYATPPPPPAAIPVAMAPAPPPVATADVSQLKLYGLLASGAVIGYANGGQRLVAVGREALPGLTLVRVEQNHAVFQSAGGEVRLGFDGVAAAEPGLAAPSVPVMPGGREEALRYRLGLAPRVVGNQIAGYTVRSNVEMPALARAGIRPGDVIMSVNGAILDEQKMQDLARIVASPAGARFEVERGGSRLRLSLRPR
jgi:type II secretory pathway component PulC